MRCGPEAPPPQCFEDSARTAFSLAPLSLRSALSGVPDKPLHPSALAEPCP